MQIFSLHWIMQNIRLKANVLHHSVYQSTMPYNLTPAPLVTLIKCNRVRPSVALSSPKPLDEMQPNLVCELLI